MVDSSPQGAPLDRYVVLDYLSEGGMGAIYLGKKLGAGGFEKEVVLKQLLPEFTSQPEFRDLFLREARLSATLDHANIVHTIDLVRTDDEYFIVMEYLPGGDLRTLLKRAKRKRRRLSPAAGIYVAREILSALAYAHAKRGLDGTHLKLIHRDVSPSNILISRNGEVKLTDFGIAKASTHNSVFYRVKGKVGYMSPEQAKSEQLDYRSDLYSLAVCLYEIVAGEKLFVQAGLTTSAEQMYSQPIPLLSRSIKDVPPEFDKIMLKALAVDRNHRFQTAGEFQEALLRCAHRAGLMISAPELATHLREVCGDPDQWREVDSDEPEQGTAALVGADGGTEVYESEEEPFDSTHELDVGDLEMSALMGDSEGTASIVNERKRREQRALTSMTNLHRLRGMELTSMVNVAALDSGGAEPLVDLDGIGLDGNDTHDNFSSALALNETNMMRAAPAPRAPVGLGPASPPQPPVSRLRMDSTGAVPLVQQRAKRQERTQPPQRRSRMSFWIALAFILAIGIGAAAAIGLSGPELEQNLGNTPDRAPDSAPDSAPNSAMDGQPAQPGTTAPGASPPEAAPGTSSDDKSRAR